MSIRKAVTILLLCLPVIAAAQESNNHKFLDKTNVTLFTTHALTTGWDAWETHNGVNAKYCATPYVVNATTTVCIHYVHYLAEANPLGRPFVRTTPGQVFFFGGTVVANVGAAYLLHRTGHHKIERIVSAVNIGFSIKGASSWTYNKDHVLPPAACVRAGTCQ